MSTEEYGGGGKENMRRREQNVEDAPLSNLTNMCRKLRFL